MLKKSKVYVLKDKCYSTVYYGTNSRVRVRDRDRTVVNY